MQELSLHVLDIAQNSIRAQATLVEIDAIKNTTDGILSIMIKDDGCGMSREQIDHVIDPFFTTRTTRKIGLGVPFFKMTAELTGGSFDIESAEGAGTTVCANYRYRHIDMLPLGDMTETMLSLISMNPDIDFIYHYQVDDAEFVLDTREVKQVLEGVAINHSDVLTFLREMLTQNTQETDAQAKTK